MQSIRILTAGLALGLVAIGVAAAEAPRASALIPAAGDGLVRQGEPSTYAGDQLFDFIDGGAPQYMEYGFAETVSQELAFHGHTYILDVYRMLDALAAFGVFSVRRPQRCTPLGAFPYSCVMLPQAMLAHGPYYIEIAAYENVPETASEMAELVRRAVSGVDSALVPAGWLGDAPFTALPEADRVAGSERLARGPVSLRTALGRDASGPLGQIGEALQSMPAGSPAPRHPTWVIASYHAQSPDDPRSAATMVAVLVDPGRVEEIWEAAREALPADVKMAQPAPGVWKAVDASTRKSIFGAMRGANLILGASTLPADALDAWVAQLVAGTGTGR